MRRTLSTVAVLALLVGSTGCKAWEGFTEWFHGALHPPFDSEKDRYARVELDDIGMNGRRWENSQVRFTCRLNRVEDPANLKFWTPLEGQDYVSFSAYPASRKPDEIRENPKGAYPLLFVKRDVELDSMENRVLGRLLKLEKMGNYPLVAVKGRVSSAFHNVAWVDVEDVRAADEDRPPATGMTLFDDGRRSASRGEWAKALESFDAALDGGGPKGFQVEVRRERGLARLKLGDAAGAEEDLALAHRWGLLDAAGIASLAESELRLGRASDSESVLREARAGAESSAAGKDILAACRLFLAGKGDPPAGVAALDALGEGLFRASRNEEALATLLRARMAAGDSPDPLVEVHIAEVYRATGNTALMAAALDRVPDVSGPLAVRARALRDGL